MKKYYLLLLVISTLVSCSESANNDDSSETQLNYFPLEANSYWTYTNVSQQTTTTDSLFVAGTTIINGNTYTQLDAQTPVDAFMTQVLSSSALRSEGPTLLINGEIGGPPVAGFPEVTIPLNDVILYNTEEANDMVLSEVTGEISQEIEGYPITIDYVVTTQQGETLSSYNVAGSSFSDVISSKIIINLTIALTIEVNGINLDLPLLDPESQDVVTITNYYAKDIGLIDSNVLVAYSLIDLSQAGIDLPIPQEDSQTGTQKIDTYFIAQ